MKTRKFSTYKLFVVFILLLIGFSNLHAQGNKPKDQVTAAAAPPADKLTPDIEVVKLSDLNFGTFSSPSIGDGEVIIKTDGTYDMAGTSGVVVFPGVTSAARFKITGTKNNSLINITVTSTDLGGLPLTLNYLLDPLPLNNLGKNEITYLNIGGTLSVPQGTPSGTYSAQVIYITFINN